MTTAAAAQTTSAIRQIIREEAARRDCRYRITRDGEVHFFGLMPNSTTTGWWLFAQSVKGALSEIGRSRPMTPETWIA